MTRAQSARRSARKLRRLLRVGSKKPHRRQAQDPSKSSPFRKVASAKTKTGTSQSAGGRAASLEAALQAASKRLDLVVRSFIAEHGSSSALRELYLAYFEWRLGVSTVYAAARKAKKKAPRTPQAIRRDESEQLANTRRLLRQPLSQVLEASPDWGEWGLTACLELRRDLGIADARDAAAAAKLSGPYLRIGRVCLVGGRTDGACFIKPHSPGLPRPAIGRDLAQPGAVVLFAVPRKGGGAEHVKVLTPARQMIRMGKIRLPGTRGPRMAEGPIRRVVSGGGGPGTGPRR